MLSVCCLWMQNSICRSKEGHRKGCLRSGSEQNETEEACSTRGICMLKVHSESSIFLETTECKSAGKTEDNFKTRQAVYV
jgi:hypothetical protein